MFWTKINNSLQKEKKKKRKGQKKEVFIYTALRCGLCPANSLVLLIMRYSRLTTNWPPFASCCSSLAWWMNPSTFQGCLAPAEPDPGGCIGMETWGSHWPQWDGACESIFHTLKSMQVTFLGQGPGPRIENKPQNKSFYLFLRLLSKESFIRTHLNEKIWKKKQKLFVF